jgi:hypothetical protein
MSRLSNSFALKRLSISSTVCNVSFLICRGGACGYNDFEFSNDQSFYAMSCNGPHVPQVEKLAGHRLVNL